MPYVPRLSEPSYTDPHWIQVGSGGYNKAIYIKGNSVLPNCFTGETKIITSDGIKRLDEVVDQEIEVLSQDGIYRKAIGHRYGFQRIYQIGFTSGDEYTCTANHRWIVKTKNGYETKTTLELTRSDAIPYANCNRTTGMQYVVYMGYKAEVFCVEEPETHTFALESGILTGNCVGYSWGRFVELCGTTSCNLSTQDAGKWWGYKADGYERGLTPRLGAVICWRRPGQAGHVAIVEQINSDGSIITSNSAYGGRRFYTQKLYPPDYTWSKNYILQGFIYNPAVTEYGTIAYTDGYVGYGMLGSYFTTQTTREDSIIREVCYLTKDGKRTKTPTEYTLSVINYTSTLNAMLTSLLSPNSVTGTIGYNLIMDQLENQNCRIAIQFLMQQGLHEATAVGIAANILAESNVNASAKGDYESGFATSFGICQWHNDRGAAMKQYVGANWESNLTKQLEFLWNDLTSNFSHMLNDIKTVADNEQGARYAADQFVRVYEKPAGIDTESAKRQDMASNLWNQIVRQEIASEYSSMAAQIQVPTITSGGTEKVIPDNVLQTGITTNYSNYTKLFSKWGKSTVQRRIANLWDQYGRKSNRGIATLNGYYLCAVTLLFATTGEVIDIVLEDDTIIKAIVGDSKGDDPSKHGERGNIYGHFFGNGYAADIIEWEAVSDTRADISGWSKKKVKKIVNHGTYNLLK